MPTANNLVDHEFGNVLVLERHGTNKIGRSTWLCQCSCWNLIVLDSQQLHNNKNISCGCVRKIIKKSPVREKKPKIKVPRDKTYMAWFNMLNRCRNPNSTGYLDIKEITNSLQESWLSYKNFVNDMGKSPAKNYVFVRIDKSKGFNKNNCRWVKKDENNFATRQRIITHNDISATIKEWSAITHLSENCISMRLLRGWPVDKALGFN